MKDLLIQIDLFGTPVNLLVKKDQLYHTKISLFLSLGVIVLSFVFFVYLLLDVIQLKNPNVTTKVEYIKNPELFTLTKDNFRFSALVTNNEATPLDNTNNRLFTLYMQQCDLKTSSLDKRKCVKTKMVSCSEVAQNSLYNKLELTQDIDKFSYCIPDEYWANDTLRLQGGLLSKDVKTFQFMLRYCDKYFEEDCASPEEISIQLRSGLILFSFVDNQKDDSNPHSPYSPINKQFITTFARDQKKDSSVYLRHSVMNTITNLFYFQESRQVEHVLQFDRTMESSRNIKDDYDYFLYVSSFFLDEQKYIYTRTYGNILNLMGDIKGLSSFLMIICGILVGPIQKTQMIAFLLHRIYSLKITMPPVKKPNIQKENTDSKVELAQQGKSILSVKSGSRIQLTSKVQPKNDQKMNLGEIPKQVSKQKISWRQKLSYIVGITKNNLMSVAERRLYKQFDIVHILNKLQEIDKLKYLLLNKHQLQLFETLSKPELSCEEFQPISEHQEYQRFMVDSNSTNMLQQMQSFMILRTETDILNTKLINMIDLNIKVNFEKEIELNSKAEQDRILQNQKKEENKQDINLETRNDNNEPNIQEGVQKDLFLYPKDSSIQQLTNDESKQLIKVIEDRGK